jgi:hypothetical protein
VLVLHVQRHHHHRNRPDGATYYGRTRAEIGRHAATYIQRDFDAFACRCYVLKGEFECLIECFDDVDVVRPREAAFVAMAFLVGHHRDENGVWMDSRAFDLCGVCDAVAYMFHGGGKRLD